MAQFASDTFAGTGGTELSAYSAAWSKVSGTPSLQIETERVRPSAAGAVYYVHSGEPASADYKVSAVIRKFTTAQSSPGVTGRGSTSADTFYYARHLEGTSAWQLYKAVAGVFTQLGGNAVATLAAGVDYLFELRMVGSTISLHLEGSDSPLISVTDTSITAAGKAGMRFNASAAPADSTGQHLDNFSADDIGGSGLPTASLRMLSLRRGR